MRVASLAGDVRRPGRETELANHARVANRAVDDQSGEAFVFCALAGQFTPDRGRLTAGVDYEHVAGCGEVDGLDGLGPVAGEGSHGDGWPANELPRRDGSNSAQARLAVRAVGDIARPHGGQKFAQVFFAGPFEQLAGDGLAGVEGFADIGGGLGRIDGLGDRPADNDDVGAGGHCLGGGLGIDAARDGEGQVRHRAHLTQQRHRVGALHLLVDRAMHVQPGYAQRRRILREADGIVHAQQVHRDRQAVVLPRLDAFADRTLGRGGQNGHDIRPGRARLDVVRAASHRRLGDFHRSRQLHEIQRHL